MFGMNHNSCHFLQGVVLPLTFPFYWGVMGKENSRPILLVVRKEEKLELLNSIPLSLQIRTIFPTSYPFLFAILVCFPTLEPPHILTSLILRLGMPTIYLSTIIFLIIVRFMRPSFLYYCLGLSTSQIRQDWGWFWLGSDHM